MYATLWQSLHGPSCLPCVTKDNVLLFEIYSGEARWTLGSLDMAQQQCAAMQECSLCVGAGAGTLLP